MRNRFTKKIHGNSTWCGLTIWVWFDRENEEWFAEVQNPDNEDTVVRTGGMPSQAAAEDQLCVWLTSLVVRADASCRQGIFRAASPERTEPPNIKVARKEEKMKLQPRTSYIDGNGNRVMIAGLTKKKDGSFWSISANHYTESGLFIYSKRVSREPLVLEDYTLASSQRNLISVDERPDAAKEWEGVVI